MPIMVMSATALKLGIFKACHCHCGLKIEKKIIQQEMASHK